jgi:hypothetical protein
MQNGIKAQTVTLGLVLGSFQTSKMTATVQTLILDLEQRMDQLQTVQATMPVAHLIMVT